MASVEMESFDPGQIDYSKCFVVTSANVLNILGTDADWKIQYQAFKIGLPQSPQAQLRGRANSDITSFDAERGSGIRKRMLNFLRGANLTGEDPVAPDSDELEKKFAPNFEIGDTEDKELKTAAEKMAAFTKKTYLWGMVPSKVVCATGGHLLAQLKYQDNGSRLIRAVSLAKLGDFFSVREPGKRFARSDLEERFNKMTQEEADALKAAGTTIEYAQVKGPCIVYQPPGYVASEMAISTACHGVRIETMIHTPDAPSLYKFARAITPEGSAAAKAFEILENHSAKWKEVMGS